jgi:hypothetical protein
MEHRNGWTEFCALAATRIRRTADALEAYAGIRRPKWHQDQNDPAVVADPPPWGVTTAALTLAAVTVIVAAGMVWFAVSLIIALLDSLVSLLGDGLHAGRWSAHHGGLLAVISDPIQHYLTVHAAGLPANAPTLWGGWLAAGAVLLVLSVFGSWGARIGWILFGAASAAMVYGGATTAGRDLSVAVTVIAWALLSVVAFRGMVLFSPRFVYVDNKAAEPAKVEVTVPAPTIKRIDVDINGRQISTVDQADDE